MSILPQKRGKSQQPEQFDASLIDAAPLELDNVSASDPKSVMASVYELVGELSEKLGAAEAEVERLQAKKTVDDVRAALLEPYANKVYVFVVSYCVVVGAMLVLAAWKARTGFELPEAILGIIAGSTAVAVIGLIGMVISGLFGGSPKTTKTKKNRTGG